MLKQCVIINCTGTADKFRARPRRGDKGLADFFYREPKRHRHLFQVHSDQRAAYVETRVGPHMFHKNRVGKIPVGAGGERSPRLRLRNGVDDIRAARRLSLDHQSAVEMLAALRGKI